MKKLFSKLFLKIMGWKLVGEVPKDVKKAVLVCALIHPIGTFHSL